MRTTKERVWQSAISALFAGIALLPACQSLPSNSPMLEQARADYRAAEEDPHVRELAKGELRAASDAMNEADRAWARNEDADEIEHMAYLAQQRIAIAREVAVGKLAELTSAQPLAANEKVASGQTTSTPAPTPALDAPLGHLGPDPADRDPVIVIGGLRFQPLQTGLNAGELRNLDKLVVFLARHPERKVLVEGFTDSAGSEAMNEALSCRRADVVRRALLARGVSAGRVGTRGYGEAFPIGRNDTAAGRRLNRRVEIVLSDDTGKVSAR